VGVEPQIARRQPGPGTLRPSPQLTEHLGYEKGDPAGRGSGNSRNGFSSKTVIGDDGAIELAVPRDRNGSFEPQLVPKGQTRLEGFHDRIISLYARGLSVREIQAHLQELSGGRAPVP
jgi:transposase-like protein